jgi:hypothetical protein
MLSEENPGGFRTETVVFNQAQMAGGEVLPAFIAWIKDSLYF